MRCVFGLVFSAVIGWLAWRRRSLSCSGIVGAVLTGTLIFGLGGIISGLLLIAFFVTSSALSHYKSARKQSVAEQFEKGNQRDLGQALANGGAATLCAVLGGALLLADAPTPAIAMCMAGVLGALAAANADTWATELGVLSRNPPRLITRLSQVVTPGASGGVTVLGTAAALAGALFIGLVCLLLALAGAALFGEYPSSWVVLSNFVIARADQALVLLLAAVIGGFGGSLLDSVLGATVQGMYYSDKREKPTERAIQRDGTSNRLIRGWVWLNNDWVNFLATLCGALLGSLVTFAASSVFGA